MKVSEIFEVLDIENATNYHRDIRVENSIKQNKELFSTMSKLRGYSFTIDDKIYGVYHFSRLGHFEIHFYDGVAASSDLVKSNTSKYSLKVYSTVFKILFDQLENIGHSIYIGYGNDTMKKIYIKLINHAFKKFNLTKQFNETLEFGLLPEGINCIIIKHKQMMEYCLTKLI